MSLVDEPVLESDDLEDGRRERYLRLARTGRDTVAGRYMRKFWHPVALNSAVDAGRARRLRIMSEDLVTWRSADGRVHLVDNRCAHRGTVLNTGTVEDDCIRCMYHGWSFRGDGQCVEAPPEHERFAAGRRIRSYPTTEYLGLVFAYLGDDEPPPLPRYPDIEAGAHRAQSYTRRCNYFYDVDNGVDPTHTYFTHRSSVLDVAGLRAIPTVDGAESAWGIVQYGRRGDKVRQSHHGMPNILSLKVPDYTDPGWPWGDIFVWRVPIDDDNHINFTVNAFHGTDEQRALYVERMIAWERAVEAQSPRTELVDRILAGEASIDDALDRPDLLLIQDDVTQEGQGPVAERPGERLGRGDVLVTLLRRIWHRELDRLEHGEPLTEWVRTDDLRATDGLT